MTHIACDAKKDKSNIVSMWRQKEDRPLRMELRERTARSGRRLKQGVGGFYAITSSASYET
jgi:hypothetical protein